MKKCDEQAVNQSPWLTSQDLLSLAILQLFLKCVWEFLLYFWYYYKYLIEAFNTFWSEWQFSAYKMSIHEIFLHIFNVISVICMQFCYEGMNTPLLNRAMYFSIKHYYLINFYKNFNLCFSVHSSCFKSYLIWPKKNNIHRSYVIL